MMTGRWIKIAFLVVILLPFSVFSIGLGEISVHSALNEKLDAEINILSVTPGLQLKNLDPQLASQEEFDAIGMPRPFWLTRLQFEAKKENERYYIHVQSAHPIQDPIVSFLIKLSTSDGASFIKAYTLFLDMPDFKKPQAPLTFKQEVLGAFQSIKTAKTTDKMMDDLDTPIENQAIDTPSSEKFKTNYGPTKENETLETIVDTIKAQYPNVTPSQIMLGIVSENPMAFHLGDITQMQTGVILVLPTESSLLAIAPDVAEGIVAYQKQQRALHPQRPAETASPITVESLVENITPVVSEEAIEPEVSAEIESTAEPEETDIVVPTFDLMAEPAESKPAVIESPPTVSQPTPAPETSIADGEEDATGYAGLFWVMGLVLMLLTSWGAFRWYRHRQDKILSVDTNADTDTGTEAFTLDATEPDAMPDMPLEEPLPVEEVAVEKEVVTEMTDLPIVEEIAITSLSEENPPATTETSTPVEDEIVETIPVPDESVSQEPPVLEEELLQSSLKLAEINELPQPEVLDETQLPEIDTSGLQLSTLDDAAYIEADDVDSQLKLAKRYIEMGEIEEARALLTKLIAQGSETQRQEALGLLEQI